MTVSRSAGAAPSATGRRRYRSKLREQQAADTRRAVVEAARELFAAKGWAATGMRDIAAEADVAVETIYAHFSSKRGVLRAVGGRAVVGDDARCRSPNVRSSSRSARARRAARVRAAASLLTAVQVRTAPIAKLLRQAAPSDAAIDEMLRSTRERQRATSPQPSTLLIGRPPTPVERDGVWAIPSPEVYLLLVEDSGWTPERTRHGSQTRSSASFRAPDPRRKRHGDDTDEPADTTMMRIVHDALRRDLGQGDRRRSPSPLDRLNVNAGRSASTSPG